MSISPAKPDYESEYFRKCEELDKARMKLEILDKELSDLHDFLVEANAIRRTLYVIFGRGFDNE